MQNKNDIYTKVIVIDVKHKHYSEFINTSIQKRLEKMLFIGTKYFGWLIPTRSVVKNTLLKKDTR